jgi:hypothetical protein
VNAWVTFDLHDNTQKNAAKFQPLDMSPLIRFLYAGRRFCLLLSDIGGTRRAHAFDVLAVESASSRNLKSIVAPSLPGAHVPRASIVEPVELKTV